jgi:diacylglycerol kinase family enzyme
MSERFERVVALVNPVSTGGIAKGEQSPAARRLAELHASKYGHAVLKLDTLKEPEATQERLHKELEAGDVLCIFGGDGTINTAVKALTSPELRRLKVPILPMWCGNGNDLANMLNGRPNPAAEVLDNANIQSIRPIAARVRNETGVVNELAAVYMGLGAGALGSKRLDTQEHRQRRFYDNPLGRIAYEVPMLLKTFVDSPEFTIEEDGELKNCFDITVANGPRMAKFAKLPVNLFEEQLFAFRVDNKRTLPIARRMLALGMGTPHGEYITDTPWEFTVKDFVPAHFDAESQVLPPDTEVSIRQFETPYYALTSQASLV